MWGSDTFLRLYELIDRRMNKYHPHNWDYVSSKKEIKAHHPTQKCVIIFLFPLCNVWASLY